MVSTAATTAASIDSGTGTIIAIPRILLHPRARNTLITPSTDPSRDIEGEGDDDDEARCNLPLESFKSDLALVIVPMQDDHYRPTRRRAPPSCVAVLLTWLHSDNATHVAVQTDTWCRQRAAPPPPPPPPPPSPPLHPLPDSAGRSIMVGWYMENPMMTDSSRMLISPRLLLRAAGLREQQGTDSATTRLRVGHDGDINDVKLAMVVQLMDGPDHQTGAAADDDDDDERHVRHLVLAVWPLLTEHFTEYATCPRRLVFDFTTMHCSFCDARNTTQSRR
jgi:hypothetical protein